MKPVNQYVLVKPFPAEEFTEGGLFVPESARQISNKVKIVAVGGGSPKQPMQFREGQTAFRTKDWGQEVEIGGELHFLMTQQSIIALEN